MTIAVLPECDRPETVWSELLEEIWHSITSQPRDLQVQIGPSELGEPCARALIARLMSGQEAPSGTSDIRTWRAWVGTQMHHGLERIMKRSVLNGGADGPRYLLETRVTVGTIGGVEITGSCDLFDRAAGCAVDWKSKSATQLNRHRREGPGAKYWAQGDLYGLGMENRGEQVNSVMFVFFPRDGTLADAFQCSRPYNRDNALAALARANQLLALAQTLGTAAAQQLYPPCTEEWCRLCRDPAALSARPGHGPPYRKPGEPHPAAATTARDLFAAALQTGTSA